MANSPLVTYEYYGPAFAHGGSQPSINIGVIHDVEAPIAEPGMARSLCGPNYFGHGGDVGNPVSIHYLVGFDDTCQGTDENAIAWHVGKGNSGTIGIEQNGYASMTRGQWLSHDAHLRRVAALMADISRRRPLIQLRWLTDSELIYAWDNKNTPGGWTTHAQMTRVGLGSTHTDPGTEWPADYVMNVANNGTSQTTDEDRIMADIQTLVDALNVTNGKLNEIIAKLDRLDDVTTQTFTKISLSFDALAAWGIQNLDSDVKALQGK